MNVYEIVTGQIIKRMEQGEIPWRKPWNGPEIAVSWENQRPYRGINTLLLPPGEYATYNKISQAGGQVKKGQKGYIAVFWKWLEVTDEDSEDEGKVKKIPFLRYYKVFEINTQAEGLTSKRKQETFEHDPLAEAEIIAANYKDGPEVSVATRAYYQPFEDRVGIPEIKQFPNIDEYYATLYHELTHSTGHEKRLNRPGIVKPGAVMGGGENYAKEELVAEIGAAFLCRIAGISSERSQDNAVAYLQNWLKTLRNDPKMIVQAAGAAQKAADYIRGIEGGEYNDPVK